MPTPTHHFRCPDELWDAMVAAAEERGSNVSAEVRGFFADYISENLPGYTSGFVAGVEATREQAVRTARQELAAAVSALTENQG